MATEKKKLNSFLKKIRKTTNSTSFESSNYAEVDHYISTGDYGLNLILTGNTYNGIPAGKVILLGGESQCTPKDQKVKIKINNEIKDVEIGSLQKIDDKFLIDTPDGWQQTGEFFEKGILKCYEIKTEKYSLIAAEKHLIQLSNEEWKTVKELDIDDNVLTRSGNEKIIEINYIGDIECVDIEVKHPNHRYYTEGIVSHNSGKSFIAAQIAANALRENDYDVIFYFDSEGGAMKEFFKNRGCDLDKIEHVLVESVEDAALKILSTYKKVEEFKKEDENFRCLFILDSLGALVAGKFISDAEKDKMVSEMGGRAKICLDPSTLVTLEDKTQIALADIKVGDKVITHLNKVKPIIDKFNVKHNSYIKIKCNGETIKLSKNHKLLVNRDNNLSFIEAKDIKITDKLVKLT